MEKVDAHVKSPLDSTCHFDVALCGAKRLRRPDYVLTYTRTRTRVHIWMSIKIIAHGPMRIDCVWTSCRFILFEHSQAGFSILIEHIPSISCYWPIHSILFTIFCLWDIWIYMNIHHPARMHDYQTRIIECLENVLWAFKRSSPPQCVACAPDSPVQPQLRSSRNCTIII